MFGSACMLKSKIRASGAARVVVDYKYRTQMEPLEHAGGSDVMGIIVANAERWLSQNGRYDREIFPTYREFCRWCGLAVGLYGWSLGWPGQEAEGGDGRAKAVDCVNFDGAGAWN